MPNYIKKIFVNYLEGQITFNFKQFFGRSSKNFLDIHLELQDLKIIFF